MQEPLSICLFNRASYQDAAFRGPFEKVPNLRIVDECFNWEELRDWLRGGGIDLVAVNLDDNEGIGRDVVKRIVELAPGCGIIGISKATDPATILGAMRSGCNQFVCAPVEVEDLKIAVERINATRIVANNRSSKRICVIGSSGGAGSTTIACNLSMEFAQLTNRRCAIVDLNLEFGDVNCMFDCQPKFSLADVCKTGIEADTLVIGKAMHELPCNVSVLARPEALRDTVDVTADGVRHMFQVMSRMYPFVVTDLPRSYSEINAAAVKDAERVLIVTQLGVNFIRNAARIWDSLIEMGTPEENIEIVLNRYKANVGKISPDDVEAHFGKPIFALIPNDYRRVQTSLDFGHPIVADDPANPVRLAIQDLAKRLAGEGYEAAATSAPSGFLDRFLRRKR